MKKIKLTTFLNILLSVLIIASMVYCYFNYKNAELRYGIEGINENEGKIKTKVKYEEKPISIKDEDSYYFIVKENGKSGLADETGKQIIECKYDSISSFDEYGYAEVEKDGKIGLINKKGQQILQYYYDDIKTFNQYGYAVVEKDKKYGLINSQCQEVIECKYDYFSTSGFGEEKRYTLIENNKNIGLLDISKGKVLLDCNYDDIIECFDGEFLLKKDNTYYYYKSKYNIIEKMSNEWKNELENKFAILESNGKYIVLNYEPIYYSDEEEHIVKYEFDENGRVWLELDNKYGCINTKGEFLIDCKYNSVKIICDGEYTVVSDGYGKCGLINNRTLELIVECKYKFISDISEIPQNCLIAFGDETNYIIDKKGNIIKECNYDTIEENSDNKNYYRTATIGGKCGLIDGDFNEILECRYDSVEAYKDVIVIENNGKREIFDLNLNKLKIVDEYDDFYFFDDKYIRTEKDEKYGVIDSQGNEILECKYYWINWDDNLVVVEKKNINIPFLISVILGSIFSIALVINNVYSKRKSFV